MTKCFVVYIVCNLIIYYFFFFFSSFIAVTILVFNGQNGPWELSGAHARAKSQGRHVLSALHSVICSFKTCIDLNISVHHMGSCHNPGGKKWKLNVKRKEYVKAFNSKVKDKDDEGRRVLRIN